MRNYLVEQKQKTKINKHKAHGKKFGVPQGSILGLILFNIFLSHLFLVVQDIEFASYDNDNTIYAAGESIDDLILSLQDSCKNF